MTALNARIYLFFKQKLIHNMSNVPPVSAVFQFPQFPFYIMPSLRGNKMYRKHWSWQLLTVRKGTPEVIVTFR